MFLLLKVAFWQNMYDIIKGQWKNHLTILRRIRMYRLIKYNVLSRIITMIISLPDFTMDDISKGLSPFSIPSCFFVVRFNGWSQSLVLSWTDAFVAGMSGGKGGKEPEESRVLRKW